MSTPRRIQLRRAKGWRLPEGAVNCARPGPWGNPFRVGVDGTAAECVELHLQLLAGNACLTNGPSIAEQRAYRLWVMTHICDIVGKDLACWCRPGQPCHADVLLRLANASGRK
jgi:hypothetical protein